MSNARKHHATARYRLGYLRSVAWFRSRDRWFAEQQNRTAALRCVVCWRAASRRDLELHHLDYGQVIRSRNGWIAREQHEDLCAMHPGCHELVHRILDTDTVLRSYRRRPVATVLAIEVARTRLLAMVRDRT
jgi:5-methylcytosine-specific restriction protein A